MGKEYSPQPTTLVHAQSLSHVCLTLWDPMDCSPPDSSVHGFSQARILEWVPISYSRGSSWSRDRTSISCIFWIGRWILYHWHHLGSSRNNSWFLDTILKSRDITLLTKVCLVKAMVFPVVMYGCESWTIKKLSPKELMLLNCGAGEDSWESLGWQGYKTNLKGNQPWILEELMLKLKLQ